MSKRLFCVRGATCAENTKENIKDNVCELINELTSINGIKTEDIVSLQFTLTPDLDCLNPATALRIGKTSIDSSVVPLFCSAEPVITGMLEKVVRVMITVYLDSDAVLKPVYINGAQVLRPDLAGDNK